MARLALGPLTRVADTLFELRLGAGFPAAGVERVREVVQAFIDAAVRGMFSGDAGDGVDSSFEQIAPPSPMPGELASWRYLAHAVDPGAFRVLGNLLNHHVPRPSSGLTLTVRTIAHQVAPEVEWKSLQRFAYPAAPSLPFVLEDSLADPPGKEVVVRIEFAETLPDDVRASVFSSLDAWERVAALGGFVDVLDMAQRVSALGQEHYLSTPRQVEYVLNGLDAPLAAFDALIAVLVRVHRTVLQIAHVEFES